MGIFKDFHHTFFEIIFYIVVFIFTVSLVNIGHFVFDGGASSTYFQGKLFNDVPILSYLMQLIGVMNIYLILELGLFWGIIVHFAILSFILYIPDKIADVVETKKLQNQE